MIGPAANGRYHGNGARAVSDNRYRGDPRRFTSYTLSVMWDPHRPDSVTLNGTEVSALASIVPGGIDLAQATGANQPTYTGAPTYNGTRSIQFVKANADQLRRANTNLLGTNDVTFITVQRFNTAVSVQSVMSNIIPFSAGVDVEPQSAVLDIRGFGGTDGDHNTAGGFVQTATPVVWIVLHPFNTVPPTMTQNNVSVSLSGAGVRNTDPGASANLFVGNASGTPADMDWLGGAIFLSLLPAGVANRIAKFYAARVGVVA